MSRRVNFVQLPFLVRRCLPHCLIAAGVLIAIAVSSVYLRNAFREADLERAIQLQEKAVGLEASTIRYRLEAETLSSFYLVTSLGTYISTNPDLSQEEFSAFAEAVYRAKPGLVNIAAAPDMVIRFIYPLEGNEQALGLDYRTHPTQRAAAMAAVESGKPVIAGPLKLVQGGSAVIGRFPVYAEGKVWGVVSTPVYSDQLLKDSGALDEDLSIEIALRGKDGLGPDGEVFFGDPALFEGRSLTIPVQLFSGSWQLGARPVEGWATEPPHGPLIDLLTWTVGGLLALVVALLNIYVVWLVKSREIEASVSRVKSRFLATMSHELRTPLNGINGMAELLRLGELDEEQRQLTETMVESSAALTGLLTDLLELSRMDVDGFSLRPSRLGVSEILDPILAMVAVDAEAKGLELRFSGVPEDCESLTIDPIVLRQTLWNLLGNAVKFTQSGYVALTLERASGERDSHDKLRIKVEDTGVGIEKTRQEDVFEDFVQEDDSSTRVFGGAGIGLSIVRRLVEAANGTIALHSEKGKGSLFIVELPLGG